MIKSHNIFKTLKIRTKAHLVLYSYINNNLNIILSKNAQSSTYNLPNTVITPEDNVATFALVRLMISEYLGIFSQKSMNKLISRQELTQDDIRKQPLKWFELIDSPDYFEWCDLISSDNVIQYDNLEEDVVYFLEIGQIDCDFLNSNLNMLGISWSFMYHNYRETSFCDIDDQTRSLLKSFDFDMHIQNTIQTFKKEEFSYYIILSIKEASTNAKDQAGFFNFPTLFQGIYKENNERWLLYSAGNLIFPSEEILKRTKAIIIPGSALNLYNNIPFIPQTVEWLKEIHNNYTHIKLLGICFGEQLICYAHGGTVDMLEAKKKDKTYFVKNPTAIQLTEDFWEIPFIKQSGVPKKNEYVISQAHGDEVTDYPEFVKNYGSSDTCKNEVFVSNDFRYFLIQGHPEYSPDFIIVRAFKFFTGGKTLSEEEMEKIKSNMQQVMKPQVDVSAWRGFCFSFLKN
jgi:GMP synthase-like glutamine amidotransferase